MRVRARFVSRRSPRCFSDEAHEHTVPEGNEIITKRGIAAKEMVEACRAEHDMEPSTSWSSPPGRSSDIQGSLLLAMAGSLLIGAWSTLGFSAVPQAVERPIAIATHPLALEDYDVACRRGDASACNNLGVCYQRGYGTAPDDGIALQLFERACHAGSAAACNNQGALLEQAWLRGDDIDRIRESYERACNQGSGLGCSNLGALHARGRGVRRDPALATWLFERACRMEDVTGCENRLGARAQAGSSARDVLGDVVQIDDRTRVGQ
jgi:Sel1 repeat